MPDLIADLQSKIAKQRNEIARLNRLIEILSADKRNLFHDLAKAKARADQLAAKLAEAGLA